MLELSNYSNIVAVSYLHACDVSSYFCRNLRYVSVFCVEFKQMHSYSSVPLPRMNLLLILIPIYSSDRNSVKNFEEDDRS